jgi:hypothetical protein
LVPRLHTPICNIGCHVYLSTLRKQGVALLDALRTLVAGSLLYPALG